MQSNHDLLHREGLGHIVIGAGGQALDTVIHRVLSGQEQAGHLGVELADAVEQLQTVEAGHHDIQHQHIGSPVAGNIQRGGAITGGLHFPANHFQSHADEFFQHLLVIDDEGPDGATIRVLQGGKVLCDFGCFTAHRSRVPRGILRGRAERIFSRQTYGTHVPVTADTQIAGISLRTDQYPLQATGLFCKICTRLGNAQSLFAVLPPALFPGVTHR